MVDPVALKYSIMYCGKWEEEIGKAYTCGYPVKSPTQIINHAFHRSIDSQDCTDTPNTHTSIYS